MNDQLNIVNILSRVAIISLILNRGCGNGCSHIMILDTMKNSKCCCNRNDVAVLTASETIMLGLRSQAFI